MPAPGHPIGGPTKNSLKAEAEYYKKRANLSQSSVMKRVEAYEIDGKLYRTETEAQVAKIVYQFRQDDPLGYRNYATGATVVIRWMLKKGWRSPSL